MIGNDYEWIVGRNLFQIIQMNGFEENTQSQAQKRFEKMIKHRKTRIEFKGKS
jgi:hypothetical protein